MRNKVLVTLSITANGNFQRMHHQPEAVAVGYWIFYILFYFILSIHIQVIQGNPFPSTL